jgi:hypothetical protein
MRDIERARLLTAHAGERRRIARRIGGNLRSRRQAGAYRKRGAVEKVAARDGGHAALYHFTVRRM